MAEIDNITVLNRSEDPLEAFHRQWRDKNAAEIAAFQTLFGATPFEFAQAYTRRLKCLLQMLPPDQHDMPPAKLGDMIWWCRDIAAQIETAVDLLEPKPAPVNEGETA